MLRTIGACLVGALLFAQLCCAEGTARREFQLPKHGTLQLDVPRAWKDDLRQPPQDLPPTIALGPARGNAFQILITPMWAIRPGALMPDKEKIRRTIAKAAEDARPQSVEERIAVVAIQGDSGSGYYFSATDRAPKPGQFKYMTQGMIRMGELASAFTILTNDDAGTVTSDALRMLKGARHVYRDAP